MGTFGLLGDVLWTLLVPPLMACACYALMRGWTSTLGTTKRPRVQRWTKIGFWIVLVGLYAIGIAFFVYAHLLK